MKHKEWKNMAILHACREGERTCPGACTGGVCEHCKAAQAGSPSSCRRAAQQRWQRLGLLA